MRTVGQDPAGGLLHPVASSVMGAQESTPLSAQDTGLPAPRPEPSSTGNFGTCSAVLAALCPPGPSPARLCTPHPQHSWDLPIRPHLAFLSTQTPSSPCLWGRPSDHPPPPLPASPRLESALSPSSPPIPCPPSGPTPSLGPSSPQMTPPAPRCPGSKASLARERGPGLCHSHSWAPGSSWPSSSPGSICQEPAPPLPASLTDSVPPLHFHRLPCPASVSHASCKGEPSMPGAPPTPSLPSVPSFLSPLFLQPLEPPPSQPIPSGTLFCPPSLPCCHFYLFYFYF